MKTSDALSTVKQAMIGGMPLKIACALLINEGFSAKKAETIMRWSALWINANVNDGLNEYDGIQ